MNLFKSHVVLEEEEVGRGLDLSEVRAQGFEGSAALGLSLTPWAAEVIHMGLLLNCRSSIWGVSQYPFKYNRKMGP